MFIDSKHFNACTFTYMKTFIILFHWNARWVQFCPSNFLLLYSNIFYATIKIIRNFKGLLNTILIRFSLKFHIIFTTNLYTNLNPMPFNLSFSVITSFYFYILCWILNFLGYNLVQKGCTYLHVPSGCVYISRDFIFQ